MVVNNKTPRRALAVGVIATMLFAFPCSPLYANTGRGEQHSVVSLSEVVFIENPQEAESTLEHYKQAIKANEEKQKRCTDNCVALKKQRQALKQSEKEFIKKTGFLCYPSWAVRVICPKRG